MPRQRSQQSLSLCPLCKNSQRNKANAQWRLNLYTLSLRSQSPNGGGRNSRGNDRLLQSYSSSFAEEKDKMQSQELCISLDGFSFSYQSGWLIGDVCSDSFLVHLPSAEALTCEYTIYRASTSALNFSSNLFSVSQGRAIYVNDFNFSWVFLNPALIYLNDLSNLQ